MQEQGDEVSSKKFNGGSIGGFALFACGIDIIQERM